MTKNRVNEIDLLRFFAVLLVVFFHYSFRGYAADGFSAMPYPLLAPIAKYGYLGVDLFFMISGFVILMTASGGSVRNFVISRLVRLYPAFWACCTITFLVTILIGQPVFSASISQYLINMTMLSGFIGVDSIDGAYWSLFIEIRFYAFVIVILALRKINQACFFLILWLICSFIFEILHINRLRRFFIIDYSPYFIAGAMYFLVWSQGISLTKIGIIIASWGLAIYNSIKILPELEKTYNTTMNSYVVAGLVTSFFLVLFLVSIQRTGFIGRNRWIIVGSLTYPLYLLHQFIGFMIFNVAYPTINNHILLWSTIILMMGLAYAVNVLVEKRFSPLMKNSLNHFFDKLALMIS